MFRKLLTFGVVITTIVWTMGAAAFVPAASAVTLESGDLIKASGPAVYFYAADGKRYTFPTESTYFSWYPDFSGVTTITDNELADISLAGNVVVRPGTYLVKINTVPKVYAVAPEGMLRHVDSEASAATLYGTDWNTKIIDIPDGFWPNYTDTNDALDGTEYPEGALVKYASGPDVYYVNEDGSWSKIADEAAFNANRFRWEFVQTAPAGMTFVAGANITGAVAELLDVSQGGGYVLPGEEEVVGGPLTVALSSDTPGSATIPTGSSAEFVKFDLAAGSDAVTIYSIKLTAYGLGDSTNIDDVTLYLDGSKVGTTKNISSDRYAIFNFSTPIELAANASKELLVKATAAASGYYALGVAESADVNSNASSTSGNFALIGNQMEATNVATTGTVTLANPDNSTTTNSFGEDDVLLAAFDLTANNEPVLWESIRMKNGGTNIDGIVDNLRLVVDGDEVATGDYVDGYADFALNNYLIDKSDTVNVEIYGDIGVANVGNQIKLYIKDRTDLVFTGQDFGFGVQLTVASFGLLDASSEGITVTLQSGDFTIDMDKAATPSQDVKSGDNDVVLATFKMTSEGENATVNEIVDSGANDFEIQGTGLGVGEIENVEMVDTETSAIYDITATRVSDTQWTLSMTDEISLVSGETKTYEIRADMSDTAGAEIDNGDTLKVVVGATALSVTGDVSNADITNITPTSVASAITTVKAAALAVSGTALTAKTVVPGATDVVVYQASLEAGTSDDVVLKSVKISSNETNANLVFSDANVTQLDLYLDGVLLKSLSNNITEATGAAKANVTFSSLATAGDANVISAGATVNLIVKASFASTFTLGTNTFNLQVADVDVDVTSKSATGSKDIVETGTDTVNSRAVTLTGVGDLKVDMDTNDLKADVDTWLLAGTETTTDRYMGELIFTTENEPVKVKTLALTGGGTGTSADFLEVKLYDSGGDLVASKIVDAAADVSFDPFDIVFPADEATSLFIAVEAKGINVDGDPTSTANYLATLTYTISGVTAEGADSGEAIAMAAAGGGTPAMGQYDDVDATKATGVTGSVLTAVVNDMPDGTLTGGTGKIIGQYKLTFNNGSNRNADNTELKAQLNNLYVAVSKSTNVVVANAKVYINGTATKVASSANNCTAGSTSCSIDWTGSALNGLADSGYADGTITLLVTGDVTTATSEYLQTSIGDLSAGDLNYNGNTGTGTDISDMRLDYTEVIGGTLSN